MQSQWPEALLGLVGRVCSPWGGWGIGRIPAAHPSSADGSSAAADSAQLGWESLFTHSHHHAQWHTVPPPCQAALPCLPCSAPGTSLLLLCHTLVTCTNCCPALAEACSSAAVCARALLTTLRPQRSCPGGSARSGHAAGFPAPRLQLQVSQFLLPHLFQHIGVTEELQSHGISQLGVRATDN